MIDLTGVLYYLFPRAQPGDWRLSADGATIQGWSRPEPEPTDTEINAARLGAETALQQMEASVAISKVRAEAQRRILARLPGATAENYRDKELNYIARHAELNAIVLGTYRDSAGVLQPARPLVTSEINEVATFSAFWEWVKANKAASNLVEADWQAAGYVANFDYIGSARWPV